MKLGQTFRRIRKAKGASQKYCAEKLKVTPAYLARIEKGLHSPKEDIVLKMLEMLLPDLNINNELVKAEVLATYRAM